MKRHVFFRPKRDIVITLHFGYFGYASEFSKRDPKEYVLAKDTLYELHTTDQTVVYDAQHNIIAELKGEDALKNLLDSTDITIQKEVPSKFFNAIEEIEFKYVKGYGWSVAVYVGKFEKGKQYEMTVLKNGRYYVYDLTIHFKPSYIKGLVAKGQLVKML